MKTILITGSTDGLGFATAKMLVEQGQIVYLHGRDIVKLEHARDAIRQVTGTDVAGGFVADLSDFKAVRKLAAEVRATLTSLDVLINNAGVFKLDQPLTADGLDARFMVNTIAPYLLTRELLPVLGAGSRVVNLSSAAQAPVDLAALRGEKRLPADLAYAESKLGLTMWTNAMAADWAGKADAPIFTSVNPKSFLGTSMVRKAYGMAGADVTIGADILCRAALSDEFARANGQYYDNDAKRFAAPHPDGNNAHLCAQVIHCMDSIIKQHS